MKSNSMPTSDPLWPKALRMPARPPKLIYLDLKHWIALSQALSGHLNGEEHKEVLAVILRAVESQTAWFPISDSTYVELLKIRTYNQHRDLRATIEQISKYIVIKPRFIIAMHEVEAVLDRLIGPNPKPINTMDYLGCGIETMFGIDFRIKSSSGEDVTDAVRASYPGGPQAYDSKMTAGMLGLNRQIIDGPSPAEELGLRELGWNPEAVLQTYQRETGDDIELSRQLDFEPARRRDPVLLRDVISAQELYFKTNTILWRGIHERGIASIDDVFPELEDTRQALDSMPSFDVEVTLKTSLHRNPNHRWKNNHIHDINALASTIPYCDVVMTDKEMVSHVTRNGLDKRYNTVVLAQLSELSEYL